MASQEEEKVWSWGTGSEGQLATGALDDELLPRLVSLPCRPVSHIACGGAHAIALAGGKVLSWGRGSSGQLGHGDLLNRLQPEPINFFENFIVCHVSAGWNHSGFVTDGGHLFTCGDGSFGQLGHGDCLSYFSPVEVSFFIFKNVRQIACGMRHSLVLINGEGSLGNEVYGCGLGRRGQLGIPTDKSSSIFSVPQVISTFEDGEIAVINANGDHSAALSANGCLYTWGRGFNSTPDAFSPQCLDSPLKFSQVALGWNHSLLLTDDGQVFMLGGTRHGLLSNPQQASKEEASSQESQKPLLLKVQGLEGRKVKLISAGAEHSALATDDGQILTWGWGEHGQLGLGDTKDRMCPQVVKLRTGSSESDSRLCIYCGSGFSFAVMSVCADSEC